MKTEDITNRGADSYRRSEQSKTKCYLETYMVFTWAWNLLHQSMKNYFAKWIVLQI